MRAYALLCLGLFGCGMSSGDPGTGDDAVIGNDAAPAPDGDLLTPDGGQQAGPAITTVFVILMENHNWSSPAPSPVILGNSSAPYINGTMLAMGAHATNYVNVPNLHPSEPNYIWLEGGSNFGLTTDADASSSHSIARNTPHLVDLLEDASISWRSYQEDMPTGVCALSSSGKYAAKHNPFVFFRDVSNDNSTSSQRCKDHIVPFSQLATDLLQGKQGRYNFITPNLCNDMHGASGCPSDLIKTGDNWLKAVIPELTSSPVYQQGHAAIFVTWDESEDGDYPIGMMVISPYAKAGYAGHVPYSHSSTLRTMEEIFGVSPMLGGAANATSLSDLFTAYP
jgi:hypothetical protein